MFLVRSAGLLQSELDHKHRYGFILLSSNWKCVPVAPQVAAPLSGDCTFEVDECGWISSREAKDRDGIEWQRMLTRTQNIRFRRRPSGNMQTGSDGNGEINLQYYVPLWATVCVLSNADSYGYSG
jgi:hypothetical protein